MNIKAEKLGLIEWITQLNDSSVIEKLKMIHDDYSKSSDWWDEISENEKESINRGVEDIDKGRVHSNETVKKVYERYL